METNSFDARAALQVGDRGCDIFRLDALQSKYDVARLPFRLKILLENLLRHEDGESFRAPTSSPSPPGTPMTSPARKSPSRPPAC